MLSKGTNNTQLSCPIGTPTPLGVISASVLVDLTPPVTQLRWGKYMEHTPVPSILLSGGHPTYNRLIKQLLLRGFDDGVLSSNSQTANPNSFIFGPAGYRATKFREVKDMGIMQDGKKRMRGYLLDQIVDPAISGLLPGLSLLTRRVSAGATPWISPTGMKNEKSK